MPFNKNQWPYIPDRISDIIDPDTLAVIESGCGARLKRPLTILENDPQTNRFTHRIESIGIKQLYAPFCKHLRQAAIFEKACEQNDSEQAHHSLEKYTAEGALYRLFTCHMGVMDTTYIIRLRNRPIAMLFSGQFAPGGELQGVSRQLKRIGLNDELDRGVMLGMAKNLSPCPEDFEQHLQREAQHIERLVENEYHRQKSALEQAFLAEVRNLALGSGDLDYEELTRRLQIMLESVVGYLQCRYALFFGCANGNDSTMPLVGQEGLPAEVEANPPHFNWNKAGLPKEYFDLTNFGLADWQDKARSNALRGNNHEYFANAGCIAPTLLGNRYRGVLVLGPFSQAIDVGEEQNFLVELTNIFGGFVLATLEMFALEQKQRAWENDKRILKHQIKTSLVSLNSIVGLSSRRLRDRNDSLERVISDLDRALRMGIHLRDSTNRTLDLHQIEIEPDDLEYERYSLAVLVTNCSTAYADVAHSRRIKLFIDPTVEFLPEADIDTVRMTIAFTNLIENAVKYAYPDTTVIIRSRYDPPTKTSPGRAYVEIDDLGVGINQGEVKHIFEQGVRGQLAGKVEGTGYGLWETNSIVQAHGGKVGLSLTSTNIQRREQRATHVIFTIEIPLNNEQAGRKNGKRLKEKRQ